MPPPITIPLRRPGTTMERGQRQFERELSELEEQLVGFKRNGLSSQRLEMAEQVWSELKKKREEVDQAYIAQLEKEASEDEISRLEEERHTFYEESEDRVWRMRTELRGCQLLGGSTSQGGGGRRSQLAKLKLTSFSGRAEDWPEFRQVFNDFTRGEELTDAVLIAYLRESLTTRDAKGLLEGKTATTEAWKALDRRFRDRKLTIINTKHNLSKLDVGRGSTTRRSRMYSKV